MLPADSAGRKPEADDITGAMSPVELQLTRVEAEIILDLLRREGALTRPARGWTAALMTPDDHLARVDHVDSARRKIVAALGPDADLPEAPE